MVLGSSSVPMSSPRPGKPYVWVSWITHPLATESQCAFPPWFKAHYKYAKYDPHASFDSAAWTANHTALLKSRAAELDDEGWDLQLENENAFQLVGARTGTILAGKPDLIAWKDGRTLIVDAKTGKQKDSDWWQVLVYLFALPLARPELVSGALEGEVCYAAGKRLPVPAIELTAARVQAIVEQLQGASATGAPGHTPSVHECRFCDIGPSDCAWRMETSPRPLLETDVF